MGCVQLSCWILCICIMYICWGLIRVLRISRVCNFDNGWIRCVIFTKFYTGAWHSDWIAWQKWINSRTTGQRTITARGMNGMMRNKINSGDNMTMIGEKKRRKSIEHDPHSHTGHAHIHTRSPKQGMQCASAYLKYSLITTYHG